MPTPTALFTGREQEIAALHDALQAGNDAPLSLPVALHGMGGVGKTQTAAQYVQLHQSEYALVAWVRGDTIGDFKSQLSALAPQLLSNLAAQADQEATFLAVRQWFATHSDWLLVVDNAEDLPDLNLLLPRHPNGRALLTTRERAAPDLATSLEILHMDDVTGATLLLRAAGILKTVTNPDTINPQILADAQAVSAELGGLALALHQAGAYMYAHTTLPTMYLHYYRQRRQELHRDYRNTDHASVTVTFDLALEQVKAIPTYGPAAVELAESCAFLAPDTIPDPLFLTSPDVLPSPLADFARDEIDFSDVCEAVTRYALLRRTSDPLGLWMHRLAQEVARDGLSPDERKAMAEHTVQAMNRAFPFPEFSAWSRCERLLPHAFVCARHIADYEIQTTYAASLLQNIGGYLLKRGRYEEAERFLKEALAIRELVHGMDSREVSTALNNLALLYNFMHRIEEAGECLEKAVAIDDRTPETDDAATASHLDNLAQVRVQQKRYQEAATLRERAVRSEIRANGPLHPNVALRRHNLALVYAEMQRYQHAEDQLKVAQGIARETIGEHDPGYASILTTLATVYIDTNLPSAAEPLLRQALAVYEAIVPPVLPDIAQCCFWLGGACAMQGRLADAIAQFTRSYEIRQTIFGPQHQDTLTARNTLNEAQRLLSAQDVSKPSL